MEGLSVTMKFLHNHHANNAVDQFGGDRCTAVAKHPGETCNKEPEKITDDYLLCLDRLGVIGQYMRASGALEGEIPKEKGIIF